MCGLLFLEQTIGKGISRYGLKLGSYTQVFLWWILTLSEHRKSIRLFPCYRIS